MHTALELFAYHYKVIILAHLRGLMGPNNLIYYMMENAPP